jgi:putative sterol carrier protein
MEPDEWRVIRSVHLDGAYNVTRPAFQAMRENGYGRIILTTSAAGLYGNFGQTNYSAAKMGLVGLMNSLKLEGEKHNIKVNTIAPIAITRLTEDILPPDLKDKMIPDFVAPMVLYLCSDKCAETGMIFNAGMGAFSRAAIVTGRGAVVGDGVTPPTAEQIHQSWSAINDLSPAKEFPSMMAAVGEMAAAFTPKAEVEQAGAAPGLTVKAVFDRLGDSFQPDKAEGVDVVFQYRITGPGGGEWYVVVKDRKCQVFEGKHEKPTTTLIISDEDFLALIKGELNAMQAFTTARLKVEGDLMKSQLIQKMFKF